ncbi:TPA: hypothetical protein N0F65_013040 [Lagenidium giganteum]|uniref:Expansin-like EG45 domain-containing protein n=1 Tax=Lagenidium giganteum TaxID=4803 RepID=A0AAV2YJK8_9STRA|nr:TPA: hypothetical protein N0F65_013040 [Lagenidium giganteum]
MSSNRSVSVAIIASALALGAVTAQESYSGDGTTYGGNALGGTCGFTRKWPAWTSKSMGLTAALNSEQWIDSMNCGRCARVQHGNNDPVIVQIVDKCPECKHGDLDFAPEAYAAIMKSGADRKPITWSFVDCPDEFVTGNLEFVLKPGSNEYWTAFQPQNFKNGIARVEIKNIGGGCDDWEPLARTEDVVVGFYFLYQKGVHGEFKLRATSVTGEVIETPLYNGINTAMTCDHQFGGGNGPRPAPQPKPTQAPDTPAPYTPAPETPAPYTPAPYTPSPNTPAPYTPATNTPAPSTDAPYTVSPYTPAPTTDAPYTVPPYTPAPVTEAPHTVSPYTPAPMTEAPYTVSPNTDAPHTDAPFTVSPYTETPSISPVPTPCPSTTAPTTVPVTSSPVPTPCPSSKAPVTVAPCPSTVTPVVTPAPTRDMC